MCRDAAPGTGSRAQSSACLARSPTLPHRRDSIKQPGPQSGRESMFSRVQTCTPPFLAQRIKLSFASESYANAIPFYMRDLNTWGFNTLRGPGPMHSTETHIHRDMRVCVCVCVSTITHISNSKIFPRHCLLIWGVSLPGPIAMLTVSSGSLNTVHPSGKD